MVALAVAELENDACAAAALAVAEALVLACDEQAHESAAELGLAPEHLLCKILVRHLAIEFQIFLPQTANC